MSDAVTIVLVHGALSDASVWRGVSERLQRDGRPVLAPAIALRRLHDDADYLASVVATVPGPVVLVGHSYGGSVISHPALARDQVRGLVFVSAFQPAAGETTGGLNAAFPGSRLGEATTEMRPYPGGQDLYLRPADFAEVYAGDLDPGVVTVMAAAQRPIDVAALGDSFDGSPSWSGVPSWSLVSTDDRSLPPAAMRWMAQRAGSTTVEVAASHASPVSRPAVVADLVRAAAG
jgi:pimeloyl-ACP methyl ester carboxylesterase